MGRPASGRTQYTPNAVAVPASQCPELTPFLSTLLWKNVGFIFFLCGSPHPLSSASALAVYA